MRILHTSDWHAGKVWKGKKRLDELERVLAHLAEYVCRESIDLLIHSGDVFDTPSPSAEAESLVFRFFKSVGQAGVPSVVIAGNHDSPARLAAWGLLSELVDCFVVARPDTTLRDTALRDTARPDAARRGGVLEVLAKNGQRATVAALPFAGARQLVSALERMDDEDAARSKTYPDRMGRILTQLARSFRPDTVNLLTAHAFVGGCELSQSERRVHVGDDWAIAADSLPASAQYVAMGHVHKPQRLEGVGTTAYYAGSALQLDFGEVAEEKSFLVIEAEPGQSVSIEAVPYEGATPLVDRVAGIEEIEADIEALSKAGWLRLTVPLVAADPDVASRIRHMLPNAVVIRLQLPEPLVAKTMVGAPVGASSAEIFTAYYRRQHGKPPDDHLIEVFKQLYAQAGGT